MIARPRAAQAGALQGRKWAEIDLRAIHVPVFVTEDEPSRLTCCTARDVMEGVPCFTEPC